MVNAGEGGVIRASYGRFKVAALVGVLVGLVGLASALQHGAALATPDTCEADLRALAKPAMARHNPITPKIQTGYGRLPLHFEANQGQAEPQVTFLARGRGYTLFLTGSEAVLVLRQSHMHLLAPVAGARARVRGVEPDQVERTMSHAQTVVRMHLVGGNLAPQVQGVDGLPGKVNYFLGNDPQQWHTNIPTYARVRYQDVYPGVDLVYYGNPGHLEYDFVVAPGADPAVIRLAFAVGAHGRAPLQIDAQGDLVLQSSGGEIRLHQPRVYQESDGVKRAIPAHYVLLPHAARENRAGGGTYRSAFRSLPMTPASR